LDIAVQSALNELTNNAADGDTNECSVQSRSSQSTRSLAKLDCCCHNNYFYDVVQKIKIAKEAVNNNTIRGTARIYHVDENVSVIGYQQWNNY
jgi:hypothetical protein